MIYPDGTQVDISRMPSNQLLYRKESVTQSSMNSEERGALDTYSCVFQLKLKNDAAQSPIINRHAIFSSVNECPAFVHQQLRRLVWPCATDVGAVFPISMESLVAGVDECAAKIRNTNISSEVDQDIFGLDVAMQNAGAVEGKNSSCLGSRSG
jgi:hypothetical protein